MVLLLFAVLVPAVCLVWFMGAAMRNERFAARQRLSDVYRVQLAASQMRLEEYWNRTVAELEKFATTSSAPAAFAKCVQSGLVDAVVIFDEQGRISYPNAPSAVASDFGVLDPKWQEASRLESRSSLGQRRTRTQQRALSNRKHDVMCRPDKSTRSSNR